MTFEADLELEWRPVWPEDWGKERREVGAAALANHLTKGKLYVGKSGINVVSVDAQPVQPTGLDQHPKEAIQIRTRLRLEAL